MARFSGCTPSYKRKHHDLLHWRLIYRERLSAEMTSRRLCNMKLLQKALVAQSGREWLKIRSAVQLRLCRRRSRWMLLACYLTCPCRHRFRRRGNQPSRPSSKPWSPRRLLFLAGSLGDEQVLRLSHTSCPSSSTSNLISVFQTAPKWELFFFGTDNSDDIKRRLAESGHLKCFLDGQNFEYLARARLLFGDTLLSSGPLLSTYGVTDESSLCLLPSLADEAQIEQYYACWRALSPASKTRLDAAYQRGGSDAAAALVAAAQQTFPTRIPSPPPPLAVPTLTKQPRQQHRQHAVQRQLQSEREDLDRRRSQGGSMASKPSMTGTDTSNKSSWKPRTHRHNHSVGSNTNLSTATSTTIPSLDPTEELPWWLEL